MEEQDGAMQSFLVGQLEQGGAGWPGWIGDKRPRLQEPGEAAEGRRWPGGER